MQMDYAKQFFDFMNQLDEHNRQVANASHLQIHINEKYPPLGRTLMNAIANGMFPRSQSKVNHGWWDHSIGRHPAGGIVPKTIDEMTDTHFALVWDAALDGWLIVKFPDRFPAFSKETLEYKDVDEYVEADALEHERKRCMINSIACNLIADMCEATIAAATEKAENITKAAEILPDDNDPIVAVTTAYKTMVLARSVVTDAIGKLSPPATKYQSPLHASGKAYLLSDYKRAFAGGTYDEKLQKLIQSHRHDCG